MRTHLVGMVHTPFDAAVSSCAFTSKNVRLAAMIRSTGREVVTYWGGDKADVSLMSVEDQLRYFGEWSADQLPLVEWDSTLPYWVEFHDAAIRELRARLEPGDIIALAGGSISQRIVDEFSRDWTVVESGVGYNGPCRSGTFWCAESYSHLHWLYGSYGIGDGRPFDVVIPNMIRESEWEIGPSRGYTLFVGRLIARKGPHVAAQIATAAGLPLILAGAGVASQEPGRIVATDGTVIEGDVLHVGAVSGEMRRQLFAGAEVFIMPTLYIEPFGNSHIESQCSGVAAVGPDYGVFTETLPPEYRYRSLQQAVDAVNLARETRGQWWRDRVIAYCGVERCTRLYDEWFDRLETLRGGGTGWYTGFDTSGRPLG